MDGTVWCLGAPVGCGEDFQIDRGRAGPRAVVIESAVVGIRVARVKLLVRRLFVRVRRALHPGIRRWLLDIHRDRVAARKPAVVDGECHGQRAIALRTDQRQGARGAGFDHSHPGHAPAVIQIGAAGGLQQGLVGDDRLQGEGLAAVPRGGGC